MRLSDALVFLLPVALGLYAYVLYPLLLWVAAARVSRRVNSTEGVTEMPTISIVVVAHNEALNIRGTIDRLLELRYPRESRQILVVSDASSDATDGIVREYAERGVEFVRLPQRGGKTASENRTLPLLRGDIIVNTDAAVRLARDSITPLLAPFRDPSVGLTSGRDISVSSALDEQNGGEGAYVDYEMLVRRLETRCGGIVGASGCIFAMRRALHTVAVPTDSLRDFAAPLMAHAAGYRAISVDESVCFVPRTPSLRSEYRRKVRTYARGMHTLGHHWRALLPWNGALFAWKLASHKLARWAVPWALAVAVVWSLTNAWETFGPPALVALATAAAVVSTAMHWPVGQPVPRPLALGAAFVTNNVAVLHASLQVLRGDRNPIWEPTRRRADRADHA